MPLLGNAFYWLVRLANPPAFALAFHSCGVRCTRGNLRGNWLEDCRDVAAQFGIVRGHVDGRVRDGRLVLRFSPDIPRASHQRFTNVLAVRFHAGR